MQTGESQKTERQLFFRTLRPSSRSRGARVHDARSDQLLFLAGCFTSQQHARASQGSAQTSVRAATQRQKWQIKLPPTKSQYTDTGQTSPSAYPILMPGAWQRSHWMEFRSLIHLNNWTRKRSTATAGIEPRPAALEVDALPLGQQAVCTK